MAVISIKAIPDKVASGGEVLLEAQLSTIPDPQNFRFVWTSKPGPFILVDPKEDPEKSVVHMSTQGMPPGAGYTITVRAERRSGDGSKDPPSTELEATITIEVLGPPLSGLAVRMQRADANLTSDLALWVAIRNSTNAMAFTPYARFIDDIMCAPGGLLPNVPGKDGRETVGKLLGLGRLPFPGVDAYNLLKTATEVFLMTQCGVQIDIDVDDLDPARFKTTSFVGSIDKIEESRRFNRDVSPGLSEELWARYIEVVYRDASIAPPTDKDPAKLKRAKDNAVPTLPYLALIRAKLKEIPLKADDRAAADNCFGILQRKLSHPCFLELIWSYWHEEGMLVQTLNAINLRFQNRRGGADRDPLAHLELDPLRPLNNLLWGYIQDEQHRLTLVRRAYEYDHQYGLTLDGKAIGNLRPADSRSRFLEAFHNLLHVCNAYFKEDDDTMVLSDAFPVLNALKEVHLLLTQGQHNQYGDLPSTARQEMLMQQWLLARPEMREFLTSRIMVAYPEPWMERVDTMKKLQAWSDTPVTHFRDLGVFGEQILLSVRFGAWSTVHESARAANWARYWRPEIQAYLHGYRAVTGADLTAEPVDAMLPSTHLKKRLASQKTGR